MRLVEYPQIIVSPTVTVYNVSVVVNGRQFTNVVPKHNVDIVIAKTLKMYPAASVLVSKIESNEYHLAGKQW